MLSCLALHLTSFIVYLVMVMNPATLSLKILVLPLTEHMSKGNAVKDLERPYVLRMCVCAYRPVDRMAPTLPYVYIEYHTYNLCTCVYAHLWLKDNGKTDR